MDWQDIAIAAIGCMVFAWLVRAVIRGVRARKYSKCASCSDSACPYHTKNGGRE